MDDETPLKPLRGPRSPGYPIINLETAIDRLDAFYNYARNRPVPVDAALKTWNYSPKSGAGLQQLSALIKYGLLEDEGSRDHRTVRITRRGLDIVLDKQGTSRERARAVRDAALSPAIHAEIHERWDGTLPDDATLGLWLTREKKFNPESVSGFLKQLRSTFAFAKLDESGTMEGADEDTSDARANGEDVVAENPQRSNAPKSPPEDSFPLPVLMDDGSYRLIHIPRLTESAFDFLKKALETYKPAIVLPPKGPEGAEPPR